MLKNGIGIKSWRIPKHYEPEKTHHSTISYEPSTFLTNIEYVIYVGVTFFFLIFIYEENLNR
jgi:hypothetical protein